MLQKVKRATFNKAVGDSDLRKALAFAIWVKDHKPASVIKGWTYQGLSQLTGLAQNTCRKRIAALRTMHLVREEVIGGVRYLFFESLRAGKIKNKLGKCFSPARRDISISKLDRTSVKTIEMGIAALLIVEIQIRKDFAKQIICDKQNGRNVRRIKHARKVCRDRGWEEYSEGGISYDRLANKLHSGRDYVRKAISYGERTRMFFKRKNDVLCKFVGKNLAKQALFVETSYHYATNNNLYFQPANTYTILQ